MVTLRQDTRGNFSARKRLPDNVREEYGRRYGQRLEAKFFASASKGVSQAKQMFRDWETEVAGRIAAIRAERTGEGIALTPQQARALAGEWYDWFVARHPLRDLQTWDLIRDDLWDALRDAIGHEEWERGAQDELWREEEELRKEVRPILADLGETGPVPRDEKASAQQRGARPLSGLAFRRSLASSDADHTHCTRRL